MTPDALRLEVPEIREDNRVTPAEVAQQLAAARLLEPEHGLQHVLSLLFSLNRSHLTLLERQRALQSFSDEYRHYASFANPHPPSTLFVRLCSELASGFKRLLLQILQGRQPSLPHLAWCLYMAQHFLAQQLLRHYHLYQEPRQHCGATAICCTGSANTSSAWMSPWLLRSSRNRPMTCAAFTSRCC